MEKDFKKEYSEHLKSETPDLWNRIESELTEKTPASKVRRFRKWMAAVPAAAAVVLLVVAAPIFMPKGGVSGSMEKSAMDLAFFDFAADNAAPEEGFYTEEEAMVEEAQPENAQEETDMQMAASGSTNGMPDSDGAYATTEQKQESANTTASTSTTDLGNSDEDYTYSDRQETKTTDDKDEITQEQDAKKGMAEVKLLHLQVVKEMQADAMNLLAIDKEHIQQEYMLYLIRVDGEDKVLAIPLDAPMEFETGIWYDWTVTDAQESGIDYIWVAQ